jgi:hypothetical protein
MTDFRALCSELLEALEYEAAAAEASGDWAMLCVKAGAALAQPEPQGPSDEELDSVFHDHCWVEDDLMDHDDFVKAARAVLDRWGGSQSNAQNQGVPQ